MCIKKLIAVECKDNLTKKNKVSLHNVRICLTDGSQKNRYYELYYALITNFSKQRD